MLPVLACNEDRPNHDPPVKLRTMKDRPTMEKTVSSQDAPQHFDELIQEVSDKGDCYVIEQDGVPKAAVVPFALYAQWKRRRERFFEQMHETADQAGLSEDEAIRRIEEAKQTTRSQP